MSASRTFPGFSGIYSLEEPEIGRAFRGRFPDSVDDPLAITRAETKPSGPVEVRYAMGRKLPSDIIETTDAAPVLISDRVLGILKAEFSGWQTYPIELFGKDRVRIPGYHGLAVHGRCGPIDLDQCVKVDKIYPGGIFPAWYGLYFDPATWDGSDLFMPAGNMGWIFVVESVKRAFEKAKITNVMFTPLDKQEVPQLRRAGPDR